MPTCYYEQMVEAGLPDQAEIVEANMNAAQICAAMRAKLTEPDHLRDPMPDLFDTLAIPTLDRLLGQRGFADELTPAFMAGVLADLDETVSGVRTLQSGQTETNEMLRELLARTGGFEAAVEDPEALSLEELQVLAGKFEAKGLTGRDQLLEFLTKKAEEYRGYRAVIDGIDERVQGLGNLKAAAREAAERLDFDEVETLLVMVQGTELEIAAETAELRARNALLRGRVEQAYGLLSAAADSFAAVDPLEPARRRLYRYAEILWRHALRYGGIGLRKTQDMVEPTLAVLSKDESSKLWADAKIWLGIALADQGIRTGGARGRGAAGAGRRRLSRRPDRSAPARTHPVDWAMTQNNLAPRCETKAAAPAGEGAARLGQAVAAYRDALKVYTRGGSSGGLGDDAEQPRQRAAAIKAAAPAGGGRGAAGAGGRRLSRRAEGLHPRRSSGGLGDDPEQPRHRAAEQGSRTGGARGRRCWGRRSPPIATR